MIDGVQSIVRGVLQYRRSQLFDIVRKQAETRIYDQMPIHEWLDRVITEVSERIALTPGLETSQIPSQAQEVSQQKEEHPIPQDQMARRATPPKRPT